MCRALDKRACQLRRLDPPADPSARHDEHPVFSSLTELPKRDVIAEGLYEVLIEAVIERNSESLGGGATETERPTRG
jgi:hypothetical protein